MIDEESIFVGIESTPGADILAQIELIKQLGAGGAERARRALVGNVMAKFHISTPVSFYYELEEEYLQMVAEG